jgi:hypothetical protein
LVDEIFAIGEGSCLITTKITDLFVFCGENYFSLWGIEMYRRSAIPLFVLLIIGSLSSCSQKSNNSEAVIQPAPTRAAATPNDKLEVGAIKEPFLDGCGCYFNFPDDGNKEGNGYVFLAEIDDRAQMNIDGKDVMLQYVRRIDTEGEIKVGSTQSEYYKSENTEVGVEYVVRKLCDPNDEACESIEYSATITVTRNGISRKISALGSCGC